MIMEEVKTEVDALAQAWGAFREENDKGVKADREKLDRINEALNNTTDRLGKLEIAMRRPVSGSGKSDEDEPESKAFKNYLRHGQERMAPDEVKALVMADDMGCLKRLVRQA